MVHVGVERKEKRTLYRWDGWLEIHFAMNQSYLNLNSSTSKYKHIPTTREKAFVTYCWGCEFQQGSVLLTPLYTWLYTVGVFGTSYYDYTLLHIQRIKLQMYILLVYIHLIHAQEWYYGRGFVYIFLNIVLARFGFGLGF